jgi:hypothetical protein
VLLAAVFLVVAGCGSGHPPPESSPPFTPDNGPGSVGNGGPKLPGCGAQANGGYCDCVDAPLFVDPPTMYFLLDRSGSMRDNGKWDAIRVAMAAILRQVGERANFGAMLFPGDAGNGCVPGTEVLVIKPGDPPSAQPGVDGPTTTELIEATRSIIPSGGTPTAAALGFALGKLQAHGGKGFAILATDGGPNCNANANCDATMCQANIEAFTGCPPGGPPNCCVDPYGAPEDCLDAVPTLDATAALAKAGFPVYVIGVPGSAPYANLLDQVATAGGTALPASPKYFRVDSTGQTEMLAALKQVAAKIVATCTFKLKQPPQDVNYVNVYFDEQVLPQDPQGGNGWKIDGDTLTLTGGACAAVMNGVVLDVRIIVGCPTVIH